MKKFWKVVKKEFKHWSTRKLTLWFAVFMVVFYALADMILTLVNANTGTAIYFDSTLTTEWFSFFKWLVGLGGSLTAVNILKGNNESKDEEEKG